MGEAGCVAWMFSKRGSIAFPSARVSEEEVMEIALDAGAEDVQEQEDQIEVTTSLEDFAVVKAAFDDKGMAYDLAEITMVPQSTVRIEDEKVAMQVLKLMDALEDCDDVQHAYANFDIPDKILNALE
jgi:transcriptional/translational regulatory protein YebC/TACO1